MMHSEDIDRAVKVFRALGDPTRLELARTVARGNCASSCGKASEGVPLSQPAISHHFGKLVDAGVLLEHKDGTQKYYEVNQPMLTALGIDITKI